MEPCHYCSSDSQSPARTRSSLYAEWNQHETEQIKNDHTHTHTHTHNLKKEQEETVSN